MLSKVLYVAIIVAMIWAVSDVLQLIKTPLERFLWIVCIIALPGLGVAVWWYVQYAEPRRRRRLAETRRARRVESSGRKR